MNESKDTKNYQINSELESIACKIVPLEIRQQLYDQEPNSPSTRLSVVVKYIHKNHPQKSIPPRMAAYMVGMDPRYPRGIHPMVTSITKQEEDFPVEVIAFKSGKKKYDSSRSDTLLSALMDGTISPEDIKS